VWLHIFDAERCTASKPANRVPIVSDDQLVLTSIDFLAGDPRRAEQAGRGLGCAVVDEAITRMDRSSAQPRLSGGGGTESAVGGLLC